MKLGRPDLADLLCFWVCTWAGTDSDTAPSEEVIITATRSNSDRRHAGERHDISTTRDPNRPPLHDRRHTAANGRILDLSRSSSRNANRLRRAFRFVVSGRAGAAPIVLFDGVPLTIVWRVGQWARISPIEVESVEVLRRSVEPLCDNSLERSDKRDAAKGRGQICVLGGCFAGRRIH